MNELLPLLAFVAGVPMMFIGFIWLLVASKRFGAIWALADILVLPVIALVLIHGGKAWREIRAPLILMIVGFVLVLITLEYLPQS